jgi:hypothetical protein
MDTVGPKTYPEITELNNTPVSHIYKALFSLAIGTMNRLRIDKNCIKVMRLFGYK